MIRAHTEKRISNIRHSYFSHIKCFILLRTYHGYNTKYAYESDFLTAIIIATVFNVVTFALMLATNIIVFVLGWREDNYNRRFMFKSTGRTLRHSLDLNTYIHTYPHTYIHFLHTHTPTYSSILSESAKHENTIITVESTKC